MKDIDNNLEEFVKYMKKIQEKRHELSDNDRVNINEFSIKLHDYLRWYFEDMYNIVFAVQTLKKEYERILIIFNIIQKNHPGKQKLNIITDIVSEQNISKWANQWSYLNQDISSDKRELKTHLDSIITNIEKKKLKDQKAKQMGKRLNRNALDTVSINKNEDTIIKNEDTIIKNEDTIIKNFIKKIMKTKLDDELVDNIENFMDKVVTVNDIPKFREKIYAYEKGGSYIRLAYSSNNEQHSKKTAEILDEKNLQFILQELVENDYKKDQSEKYYEETNELYARSDKTLLDPYQSKRKKEVKEAKERSYTLNQIWKLLGFS